MLKTNMLSRITTITLLVLFQIAIFSNNAAAVDFDTAVVSTERVQGSGGETDGESLFPSLSHDGRYVVFASEATGLSPDDANGNWRDVFLYDSQTGDIETISIYPDGSQMDWAGYPDISPDGRYVVFREDDIYGYVYVRDMDAGETYYIGKGGWHDSRPSISSEGRYIAYNRANNVYLYDRGADGMYNSTDDSTTLINSGDYGPVVSSDGRYVVYDHNDQVYVYDIQSKDSTQVSITSDGESADAASWYADISTDGRYVSFETRAGNLTPEYDNSRYWTNVYVHDRDADNDEIYDETGAVNTILVSKPLNGTGFTAHSGTTNFFLGGSSISADGRYVVFESEVANLIDGDTNNENDIFVRDIIDERTIRVSVSSEGVQGVEPPGCPMLSGNGRVVVYASEDANLVANDNNEFSDIFISTISKLTGSAAALFADRPMSEENFNGRILTVTLINETFTDDSLDLTSFGLSNAPPGTSIHSVNYVDSTQCNLELAYDGTDFDADVYFSVVIAGSELAGDTDVTSSTILVQGAPEPGLVRFESSELYTDEGAGTVFIKLIRYNGSDGSGGIVVSIEEGTAVKPDDYDYTANMFSGDIAVPFNEGETEKYFTIDIVDDELDEDNENLNIYLYQDESDIKPGELRAATLTLIDNIEPLQMAAASLSDATEGEPYTHTFTASGGIPLYSFSLAGGSLPTGLSLAAEGELSGTPSESGDYIFTVDVADNGGGTDSGNFSLTVNPVITPGILQFPQSTYSVTEAVYDSVSSAVYGGTATITVVRTGSDGEVSVQYSTSDGTAVAGQDYTAASGTLIFFDGQASQSFDIDILDDGEIEGNETVNLILNNPTGGASLGSRANAVLIITDDEESLGDTSPPTWPDAQLSAGNIGYDRLTLNWTLARDDTGVENYRIFMDDIELNTVSGDQNSFTVTGLSARTTYNFKVEADDTAGNWSTDGPVCTAATNSQPSIGGSSGGGSPRPIVQDEVPPYWPGGGRLTTEVVSETSLLLKWTRADDNEGVTGYWIFKGDNLVDKTGGSNLSHTIKNLSKGNTYTFTVVAVDAAGNESAPNPSVTVTTGTILKSIVIKPGQAIGGMQCRGRVTLSLPAVKGDVQVQLSTDNEKVIKLPASVTITKGKEAAEFDIQALEVDQITQVTVTAELDKGSVQTTLAVLPQYEYVLTDLGVVEDPYAKGPATAFTFDASGKVTGALWVSNPADGSSYLPPGATFGRLNLPPEAEVFASSASGSAVGQLRTTERTVSSELVNVIRAFRYRPSYGLQVLGTLGGMNSAAYDVNNEGFIVGWSETAGSTESHAFLAAPGTGVTNPAAGHWVEINQLQMTDLGTLGGSESAAYGINDAGYIVGKSDTTEGIEHAFVYRTTGGMVDLNYLIDPLLGWRLTGAYDINNLGQIIAEGFVDGKKRVCLLTPRNPDDIYQAQVQFPDVMPTDWYFGDVMDLLSKGVISGYPDGTFKPRNSVNVDEFISMTVTSLGHSDLDAGAAYWAGPSIERARQLGLVEAGEFTNYRRAITRVEMARILARAVGETGYSQDNDGQIADLGTIAPDLRPYVVAAYSKGLVAGFPDGKFKPEGETTRAQAAVVIMRMIRTA
ncbi:MAG: hypothetical protein VR67_15660 [Peptococcaceae bacterium BRH_c8a]|nr:MAG: hypothetical protein VR67_15660 [Peptococcaceae bacterium BRH_c8a]